MVSRLKVVIVGEELLVEEEIKFRGMDCIFNLVLCIIYPRWFLSSCNDVSCHLKAKKKKKFERMSIIV